MKKHLFLLLAAVLIAGCAGGSPESQTATVTTTKTTTMTQSSTSTVTVLEQIGPEEFNYKLKYELLNQGVGAKLTELSKGKYVQKEVSEDPYGSRYLTILEVKDSTSGNIVWMDTFRTSVEDEHYFLIKLEQEPENIQLKVRVLTLSSDRLEKVQKICTKNASSGSYNCPFSSFIETGWDE